MNAPDLRPLTALMDSEPSDPSQIHWREIAQKILEKVNEHLAPLRMVPGTLEMKATEWYQQVDPTENHRLKSNSNLVLMSDKTSSLRNRPGYLGLKVTDLPEWLATVEEAVTYKRMSGYGRRTMRFLNIESPPFYRALLEEGRLFEHLRNRATRMAEEIQDAHNQLMAMDPPKNDWERMMKPNQLFRQAEIMTLERWFQPSAP